MIKKYGVLFGIILTTINSFGLPFLRKLVRKTNLPSLPLIYKTIIDKNGKQILYFSNQVIQGKNLVGLVLENAQFYRCTIKGESQKHNFENAQFVGCKFMGDFSGSNLNKVKMFSDQTQDGNLQKPLKFNSSIQTIMPTINSYILTDISGANFQGATLIEVHMPEINAQSTNFELANLSKANLEKCDFTNAIFKEAILDDANMKNSNNRFTHFTLAKLRKTNLQYAQCPEADFTEANLDESILNDSNMEQANFLSATLIGVQATKANFSKANLKNIKANPTNFYFSNVFGLLIDAMWAALCIKDEKILRNSFKKIQEKRNFKEPIFNECNFENADLESANLIGSSFERADLNAANAKNADLKFAQLNNAKLIGTNLENANLGLTLLSKNLVLPIDLELLFTFNLKCTPEQLIKLYQSQKMDLESKAILKSVLIAAKIIPEDK